MMNASVELFPSELVTCIEDTHTASLKLFHLNVRSAKNKIAELEILFSQFGFPFDVVMLSETWYDNEIGVFTLPQYRNFYVNRSTCRGGGVCMLINENLECELLPRYSFINDDFEVLTVRVGQCIVVLFYRPPNGNSAPFFEFLESLLGFVNDNKFNVILGGDFNINMLCDTSTKKHFEMLLSINGCINVITGPTRVTSNSETLIDLFITNFNESSVISGIIKSDISDHFPIFLFVRGQHKKTKKKREITFQNITIRNLEEFRRSCVSELAWDTICTNTDPNQAYDMFLDHFIQLYRKHFPNKKIKVSKEIRKPWITSELLAKINIKNRMYKKFIQTRNPEHLQRFKEYRNQLTKEIKKARCNYYHESFQPHKKRIDIIWKKINSVLRPCDVRDQIETLVCDGEVLAGLELANKFNDYFVNLAEKVCDDKACESVKKNCNSIFLEPVTEYEVYNVFLGLSNSSSCDADGIQSRPLKYVIDILAPCLTHIFNLSLSSGIFPKQMQKAKISVLYKKGDKNNLGNYRPVSILPVFSKGLETLLHRRLTGFFEKHRIISESQYGFRKNKSTQLALLEQKEYILQNFENRNMVLGIFIDFTKAFDYINHDLLIKKLEIYGIRGTALDLIKSYLAYRTQFVCLNSFNSSVKNILKGVPQGSILGPLLFNLYTNDITQVTNDAKFVIYADDTSLFFSAKDANYLLHIGNITLKKINDWSKLNGLTINESKTKAIFFRPKNKLLSLNGELVLNSKPIEIVKFFKTLGVVFSENMLWDKHIEYLIPKLSRVVGIVCRYKNIFPISIKLLIYNSLFFSLINYCNLVWGTTGTTNLQKIFMLQKKIVRFICNVPYLAHTENLFQTYNILPIQNIYKYRLATTFRNETKNNLDYLQKLANLTNYTRIYSTRESDYWKVPTLRLILSDEMLCFQLPTLLNAIEKNNINLRKLTVRNAHELNCLTK